VILTALIAGLVVLLWSVAAGAAPVVVRFAEGVARGFPVLRSPAGHILAHGELTQVARGDRVESRLVFRFLDGSIYDETVQFSQKDVFTLLSYRIVQRGPAFPESLEASIDRASGRYDVRYRADADSPEETISGRFELAADVYNGMLTILLKNLAGGASETVHIVAFTPQPRHVRMVLTPHGHDEVAIGPRTERARRYRLQPELGLLNLLLVADPAPMLCWILDGTVPAFIRFQGPLYLLGPVWRIDLN
jgi:hypothetical protein